MPCWIQNYKEIVCVFDVPNPTIAGKLDNVHLTHPNQGHDHNDRKTYDQNSTIHVRLIRGNPKKNKCLLNIMITFFFDWLNYLHSTVVWIQAQLCCGHNLWRAIPAIRTVHQHWPPFLLNSMTNSYGSGQQAREMLQPQCLLEHA